MGQGHGQRVRRVVGAGDVLHIQQHLHHLLHLVLVRAAVISPQSAGGPEAEAVAALVALGYSASEAAKAVSKFAGQTEKSDELIFMALKSLG